MTKNIDKTSANLHKVHLIKFVHGGQAIGTLEDGRTVFLWNALPGEEVLAELTKNKKNLAEGIAVEIIKKSEDRDLELSRDDVRLSTQPWAIMNYEAELKYKTDILNETFSRAGLDSSFGLIHSKGALENYRNKVEFSFYGDDSGIHFAHYLRASHKKIILQYPYNSLIYEQMSSCAEQLLSELNGLNIRASDLKSVIIRSEFNNGLKAKTSLALFVKTKNFPKLSLENLVVFYSNPKSPASVPTEVIYRNGSTELSDKIQGVLLHYDVMSFFQVNVPIFELSLEHISESLGNSYAVDMYSGVGSIGLSLGDRAKTLVEVDPLNVEFAKKNATNKSVKVVHASSEEAIDFITGNESVIVDPPRSGLHNKVINRLLETKPPQIIYLSCNPSTQARDVALLVDGGYYITRSEAYNFFPRTPHIESLIVLELKA